MKMYLPIGLAINNDIIRNFGCRAGRSLKLVGKDILDICRARCRL